MVLPRLPANTAGISCFAAYGSGKNQK